MASRTPEQLAFVLGSINKIADPAARLGALRDLEAETVQGEAAASNISPVDKAMGGPGVIQPAAYTALLGSIRQSASEANAAAQKAAQPSSLNTAPTAGSQDDIRNGLTQQQIKIAQDRADLAQVQAAGLDKIRQAQLEGKDVQAALNQAKFDFAQKVADQKAEQATAAANARVAAAQALADAKEATNQNTNARDAIYEQGQLENTAQGQRVTQADTRATNAKDLLQSGGTTALDIAKGGGTTGQIGDFLKAFMGFAPQFTASMGGAPVDVQTPVSANHLAQIAQLMLSGAVPPDANGNRGPNAVRAVAAQNGLAGAPGIMGVPSRLLTTQMPGAGAPAANWGPGNPDYERQMAMGAGAGSGNDTSQAPQFTAPDLVGAGSN